MFKLISLILVLLLVGCSDIPIHLNIPPYTPMKYQTGHYAIIIPGVNSTFGDSSCPNDELDAKSLMISDPYIDRDIVESTNLAKSKGFECFVVQTGSDFNNLIDKIARESDIHNQLIIFMSGECDAKGFNNLVHMNYGINLIPPNKKLNAEEVIARLGLIKGTKALVINGCQSGCFADAARKDKAFNGVVITACSVGTSTTQCEKTGTSALYAAFLGLYKEHPRDMIDLAYVRLKPGDFFENLRHKISDIGSDGLPISYDAVFYATCDFWF